MNEEDLFQETLSRPVEERAAFLAQACAGQPERLAAYKQSSNTFDNPEATVRQTGNRSG